MIINFIGGPGVGKTTLATKVFSKLKQEGVSVGLVTEFATQCIMEKQEDIFNYQYFVTANQLYRQETTEKHYGIVVTDSPILLYLIYDTKLDENLSKFLINKYRQKKNLLFYIERNKNIYVPEGRRHSLSDGMEIDIQILNALNNNVIDYIKISNTKEGEQVVFDLIQQNMK